MKYSEFMNLASCLTAADMQARFAYRTKNRAWFDALAAVVASREEGSLLYAHIDHVPADDSIACICVGLPVLGIVAKFIPNQDGEPAWIECSSRGDFGNNHASGGHWKLIRRAGCESLSYIPDIVWRVIEQQAVAMG